MTPTPDPLRAALNAVVTKTTWRPDNTVLIHDGTAWNTLVGRIVMATNGDANPDPGLWERIAAIPWNIGANSDDPEWSVSEYRDAVLAALEDPA